MTKAKTTSIKQNKQTQKRSHSMLLNTVDEQIIMLNKLI